jgi:hypothetical protein
MKPLADPSAIPPRVAVGRCRRQEHAGHRTKVIGAWARHEIRPSQNCEGARR